MASKTTIEVYKTTASDLHDLKNRGDSYDDVVNRLLETQAQLDNQATEKENASA